MRLHWSAKTRSEADLYQKLLRERLDAMFGAPEAAGAGRVVLAGLEAGGRIEAEVAALLGGLGLAVARTILPDLPPVAGPVPVEALVWVNPVGWECAGLISRTSFASTFAGRAGMVC